ncbi:MAG: NAD-dependent epimerase/dehydratase family protein, partial [Chloroflexota bacterium]
STLDVLGYRTNDELITETNGDFNFDKMGYYYGETKLEGERQLRAFCQEAELDYVVIYPGFMIGPFDYTLQLGSLFFDLINDELPGYIIGGSSFCHVTEVAKAHVEAAIRGRSGEGYICAGAPHTNMTHKALWQKMGAAVGAKPLTLTLPRWGFLAYAYLSEFVATFTQKKPAINPGMARYMMVGQYASSKKAEQELGYRIPTIDECIRDALSWYRTHGFMTG